MRQDEVDVAVESGPAREEVARNGEDTEEDDDVDGGAHAQHHACVGKGPAEAEGHVAKGDAHGNRGDGDGQGRGGDKQLDVLGAQHVDGGGDVAAEPVGPGLCRGRAETGWGAVKETGYTVRIGGCDVAGSGPALLLLLAECVDVNGLGDGEDE